MPYTYLVGWSNHNIYYYGSRYAKKSTPNDLWKSYFTSSKEVKLARQLLGEPNIIHVRRVFESKEKAIAWEYKVLRRMKVTQRDEFLNKHCTPAPPINRMFGANNPQNNPKWFDKKSKRGRERAVELKSQGLNIMGQPLKPPVVRTCPCCGSEKIYKTYRLDEVDIIKTRLCKSCAGKVRNQQRAAAGFYEKLKKPQIRS